jgi:hypothetical protein
LLAQLKIPEAENVNNQDLHLVLLAVFHMLFDFAVCAGELKLLSGL